MELSGCVHLCEHSVLACSVFPALCVYTHTHIYPAVYLFVVHDLPTVNISSALLLLGCEHEAATPSPLRPQILPDMFSCTLQTQSNLERKGGETSSI